MALIYIVDDEPNIRKLVCVGLREAGFEVMDFSGGDAFLHAVHQKAPDAVVLDWMMPAPDGLALCGILRQEAATRSIPIIMLTARSDEVDTVVGLECGADDYLTKPFGIKELVARVRALLRREEYRKPLEMQVLKIGNLSLDPASHKVRKNGQMIELSHKEYDLLYELMEHAGQVISRDTLLDRVWDLGFYGDTRTVDVHIRYLRQKIEDVPESPKYIQTVRGFGYRFAEKEDFD